MPTHTAFLLGTIKLRPTGLYVSTVLSELFLQPFQLSAVINMALLEHSHLHLPTVTAFAVYRVVDSHNKDLQPAKLRILITIWIFIENSQSCSRHYILFWSNLGHQRIWVSENTVLQAQRNQFSSSLAKVLQLTLEELFFENLSEGLERWLSG